jgi:hypothetical protein
MGDLQARANLCNILWLTRNEQVSHRILLKWIYCNRTATETVQVGTQRTQQMLDVGKNAAKQLNYRTSQYGMEWGIWNLQGGGRWFEPSIAHLEKALICR